MNNNKKKIFEQPSIRKSKTTVGVIGCGYWGPNLVRNFASLDSCEVKAVCDTDPARLKHISKINPGVTGVTDAGQVIDEKNIDAVVIA
ncbi:MAG: Gfo/Idh/MocA family oxidoreductase, partial [Candidatus Hydrogenedentes bacterium]|nr:Gfo/Idh/MocA family oxidoreductase [Candidatus Hydrogenedentota bacterium]